MLTQVEGVVEVTPTLFSSTTKGKINHRDADYILSSYVESGCLFPKEGGLKRRDGAKAASSGGN